MLQVLYCHLVWSVNPKRSGLSRLGGPGATAGGNRNSVTPRALDSPSLVRSKDEPETVVNDPKHRGSSSMLAARNALRKGTVMLALLVSACGYSQEEWDQKVRENESLRDQLTTQRQAHKKCEADYAAALQQVDELKRQLTERGVNLENMSAS